MQEKFGAKLKYTGCTLKLRAVKLLFVIFGRLSYTFFGKNMVLRYGRLSYITWKNMVFRHGRLSYFLSFLDA